MIITENITAELLTDDGHSGTIQYAFDCNLFDRKAGTINILKEMGIGNIIHIGCCGHLHNIKKQMEEHSHFHVMLTETFKNVIGFDINESAINYLQSFNVPHIYKADFIHDTKEISHIINEVFGNEPFIILLPEVLEHIPNPVSFLTEIAKHYGNESNKIVITVPNAYGFGRIRNILLRNKESINMDHKYMFTPTTLLKVMFVSNIQPINIHFFDLYKFSRLFKRPALGNTILSVGKFK